MQGWFVCSTPIDSFSRGLILVLITIFQLVGISPSHAQDSESVEVNADRLEYEEDKKLLKAVGNVVIQHGPDTLRADYAEIYKDSKDVFAKGHVVLERENGTWEGDELTYNLEAKTGDFGTFDGFYDPYYVRAQDSKRIEEDTFQLEQATLTTCPEGNNEFRIQSKSARIVEGKTLTAKNVVVFLGPIPIFYLPYWKQNLEEKDTHFDFLPGYSSEMGAYLLTSYNRRLHPAVKSSTHLDVRAKRGLGLGQDFFWKDPRENWVGSLQTYYIDDSEPFDDAAEEGERGADFESERYRVRLSHRQAVSSRAYAIAEVNYQSDPDIVEDFFDEEFRHNAQPESRISIIQRGDRYTAGVEVNKRLNDFYENIDRLPEITLDLDRRRISGTPLYYESESSAVYLERVFPDRSTQSDVDTLRVDSDHTLLYPTRHFGFLNAIPRLGYRATYYSDTAEKLARTNLVSMVDSNGVVSTSTSTNIVTQDGGSELRHILELGLESSFKAFRVVHDQPLWGNYVGLRHVVEPFANYTYIPDPNVRPKELHQFDRIDRLDEVNEIRFGVRNKLQTKRNGRIHDLVDGVVSTAYHLDLDASDDDFDDLVFDVELRLVDWAWLEVDGDFSIEESELDNFNTKLGIGSREETYLYVEHRYREVDQSLFSAEITSKPNSKWKWDAYWRYEFEESELEEQNYFLQHHLDCLGIGLGYRQVKQQGDDDRQVWLQVWLLAFPRSALSIGR